jgi:DNA modification methylase
MNRLQILTGDCRDILPTLEAGSVQCCVTSPPYWGLRDYGTAQWEGGDPTCDHTGTARRCDKEGRNDKQSTQKGSSSDRVSWDCLVCGARRIDSQLGLEATPEEYIAKMVAVFREVWRVLRDDGTLWLNVGDSYASDTKGSGGNGEKSGLMKDGRSEIGRSSKISAVERQHHAPVKLNHSLKPKDLCMMPARLAMALQADGWYLRSEIVWAKPNPMPESVTDRPTKAHEMIYLLAKQERYFYDANAIREPNQNNGAIDAGYLTDWSLRPNNGATDGKGLGGYRMGSVENGRNKRSVWTIATQPYAEAHFATFPEEIPKLCILAGSKPGDTILDPFAGSGTVGKVALEFGRRAILIELNPAYIELAEDRTFVTPGFL